MCNMQKYISYKSHRIKPSCILQTILLGGRSAVFLSEGMCPWCQKVLILFWSKILKFYTLIWNAQFTKFTQLSIHTDPKWSPKIVSPPPPPTGFYLLGSGGKLPPSVLASPKKVFPEKKLEAISNTDLI